MGPILACVYTLRMGEQGGQAQPLHVLVARDSRIAAYTDPPLSTRRIGPRITAGVQCVGASISAVRQLLQKSKDGTRLPW